MNKLLVILSTIVVIVCLSILASYDKAEPITANSAINPFSSGGNERNEIVVISDIHLGADLAYAETNKNLAPLERFLEQVRVAPQVKGLVIAGDLLDEWFVPATVDTYQGKDQKDFVARIAAANKGVFDGLNRIIQEKNTLVTYVPGNHDLTITAANVDSVLPGINQARDEAQGLGTYFPADFPQLAIEHGHRYNFFCAPDPISNQDIAPGNILPPGYFYTRIGVLSAIQKFPPAHDVMPVVTRNANGGESQDLLFLYWNVWNRALQKYTVENSFDEKIIVTNIDGFKGLYSINDLLPYQTTAGGLIDVNLFAGVQDAWNQRQSLNHVAVNIPAAQAIANAAKASESDNQAKNQYFNNPASDKRIVIFGHTHDAKIIASNNHGGQKSIYANTGTWIDHNSVVDTTMDFVVVTPQNADETSQTSVKLYNFENEVVTKMAEDSVRF